MVAVAPKQQNERLTRDYLDELVFLCETAKALVVREFVQKLERPDHGTYVGKGKLEEISAWIADNPVDIAVFDDDLSPVQVRNLEEVLKISEFMNKDMSEIHPSVLFDLKKYHSAAYEVFEKHRDTHFMDTVARNLERGIQEGVYRKEIDVKVFARLRVIEIEAMFNPVLLNGKEFNPARVQLLFIDHFVRGLVTPKGLEEWERISQPLFQVIR